MKRWVISFFIVLVGVVFVTDNVCAEKQAPYKACIVMESSTGNILESENIHLKWPTASVTKLMLVDIVMERIARGELNLSDKIAVSGKASKMGGSQVYLKEGEMFTLEELLKATLIASANDAAYAIGEFVSGSVEEFVVLMNRKAKALNMADTEYHFVHGLPPSKGQQGDVSSCYDLAVHAREILKYPKVLEWTSVQREGFRDGKFIMYNSNKLLAKMSEIDGLKTGYYRAAGFNVVATAKKKDNLRLIVVILGSPKSRVRDRVAVEKFKKYFSQYVMFKVVKKSQVIDKEIVLTQGETKTLKGVAGSEFLYPIARDKQSSLKTEISLPEKIDGEIQKGQKLGELSIIFGEETVGKVDIVSPAHVLKAGIFTRLLRYFRLDF